VPDPPRLRAQVGPFKNVLFSFETHLTNIEGSCSVIGWMSPRFVGLLSGDSVDFTNFTLLPVLNRAPVERPRLPLRFTLCIANMFNSYDNVLQFVQVTTFSLSRSKVTSFRGHQSHCVQVTSLSVSRSQVTRLSVSGSQVTSLSVSRSPLQWNNMGPHNFHFGI
jgi:hypothetical protein